MPRSQNWKPSDAQRVLDWTHSVSNPLSTAAATISPKGKAPAEDGDPLKLKYLDESPQPNPFNFNNIPPPPAKLANPLDKAIGSTRDNPIILEDLDTAVPTIVVKTPAMDFARNILSQEPFQQTVFREWVLTEIVKSREEIRSLIAPSEEVKLRRRVFEFLDALTEKRLEHIMTREDAIMLLGEIDDWESRPVRFPARTSRKRQRRPRRDSSMEVWIGEKKTGREKERWEAVKVESLEDTAPKK